MGLVFLGVVFEFDAGPQMYFENFVICCKVESSQTAVGISFQHPKSERFSLSTPDFSPFFSEFEQSCCFCSIT